MKRKILFAILCIAILSIGTIVYASFVQPDSTSMLSDREMTKITGTCACYEDPDNTDYETCRWYGSFECDTGSSCPDEEYEPSQEYLYKVTTDGQPNNKVPNYYLVDCWTRYSVDDDGDLPNYVCETDVPDDFDWGDYGGWWFSCEADNGETCHQCSFDQQIGYPYPEESAECVGAS